MPINDPVQNRKIAPGSLAFERRRMSYGMSYAAESPDGDVNNYQYYVEANFDFSRNYYINRKEFNGYSDRFMLGMSEAEHRAKHWVGDYKRSFQWDLNSNITYDFDTWNVVPYNNEVLEAMGTLYTGSYLNSPNWRYICQEDAEGTWFVHAFHLIRFGSGTQVYEGRLAIFVNDVIVRVIDAVDNNMMGENNIRDLHLSGSAHVALKTGDKLDIRFKPTTGNGGSSASLAPTSVYAYVTAHRENCNYNKTNNTVTTGNAYSFDHSTP